MTDVFISYVHEDNRFVGFLANILRANSLNVWLDKEQLMPGSRWKSAIRDAIRNGTYFVSIHSKQRQNRSVSYANEELVVAIEEVRKRPISKPWLIPVVIDDSEIEDRDIGGGETLNDLQRCDLTNWSEGIKKLMSALGVSNPSLDLGEPLANGLPSCVDITKGVVRYDVLPDLPIYMQGLEFRVENGWCQRQHDGSILAYIETVAPMKVIREINVMYGLSGFHAVSTDDRISDSPQKPTKFFYSREIVLPKGMQSININTGQYVTLPFDFRLFTSFEVNGFISGMEFSGSFIAHIESRNPMVPLSQVQKGEFTLTFSPALASP